MEMKWDIEALSKKRSAKYDVLMKHFVSPKGSALRDLLEVSEAESVTTEFANLHAVRADALFRISSEHLVHVEFQTRWETDMPWRMLDYLLRIVETHGRDVGRRKLKVDQVVVYIGTPPLPDIKPINKGKSIESGKLFYSIRAVDIRGWASSSLDLLESNHPDDWILGLLCQKDVDLDIWMDVALRIRDLNQQRPEIAARACAMLLVAGTLRDIDDPDLEEIKSMTLVLNVEETTIFRSVFDKGERAEAISAVQDAVAGQEIQPEEWEANAVLELNIDDLRTLRRMIPKVKNLAVCLESVGVQRPPMPGVI